MTHIFEILRGSHIDQVAIWLIVAFAAVLGAMIIDLFCGIYKAAQAGIARTSTALRRSCTKAQHYFLPMVCLSFADILLAALVPAPVFSTIWALFCVVCEFKSVLEKSSTKEQMRDEANTMGVIIKNKDDLAAIMLEVMNSVKCEPAPKPKRAKKNEN